MLDDWGGIHAGMVADAHARADRIQVVLIGDSITARWTRSPGEKAWAEHLAPLGALNLGISSDATQHVLWRLQHGVLDGLHPKAVLIMIGTNNVTAGADPESIAYGVWAIVDHVRRTLPGARVLVQAIFPRIDRPGANERVGQVNAILARLDDGQAVRFMDFGARFLAPDGKPDPAVFTDGIHPNKPEGFRIWSEAIMPTVRDWIAAPPLADLPPPPPPVAAPKDRTPSTPAPRNEFLDRHARLLAISAAQKERCRLLFLGDERMRSWDRAEAVFRREYAADGALNLSIPGARPEHVLWQLAHGELDGLHPGLVVLQTQEAVLAQPEGRAAAGMAEVLRQVRARLPQARVLLLGAFPVGERASDPRRQRVAQYNARLAGLADGTAVAFLDVGAAFLAADGSCPAGTLPHQADGTEAAYSRWADAQRVAIRGVLDR